MRAQRDALVYPGFFGRTPWTQLAHLPRYLKALDRRLAKYPERPDRDAGHADQVAVWWQRYGTRRCRPDERGERPALEDFRWLLEELRVSLFAQELRTPQPVSFKRLDKAWRNSNGGVSVRAAPPPRVRVGTGGAACYSKFADLLPKVLSGHACGRAAKPARSTRFPENRRQDTNSRRYRTNVQRPSTEAKPRPQPAREIAKILHECRDLAVQRLTASLRADPRPRRRLAHGPRRKTDIREEQQLFLDAAASLQGRGPALMAEFEPAS